MKLVAILSALWLAALPATAAPPQRVVSLNLCTDQMAMLLAAPGQLVSVSQLARDPHYSSMVAEAARLIPNTGQAEEIAFLRPDLVLAGRYTTATTVSMLQRLGIPVAVFEPENSIADIRANLLKMGAALDRRDAADAAVARLDAQLAAMAATLPPDRPEALLYYVGGYSSGAGSLADDILRHAGLTNLAPRLGLAAGGTLPLETLILSGPDVLVRGQRYAAPSRGQEVLDHPALASMLATSRVEIDSSAEWVCGTPFTVAMIPYLASAARPE